MNQYKVIGVMSGSSLDGLDVCYATIFQESGWSFQINDCVTFEIPERLKKRLKESDSTPGHELMILDIDYGQWAASKINEFSAEFKTVDVVGFHGHTVFHEPDRKLSLQIGRGSIISHITGLPVVDDFRMKDILNGGPGAPLVPFGDVSLFPEFKAWVNLGGIANLTVRRDQQILAWDLAPCNQVLNHFARKLGKSYDQGGALAQKGRMDDQWSQFLQSLPYFRQNPPKSLSNQWISNYILGRPLPRPENALYTFVNFLSNELTKVLGENLHQGDQVLFTGGGTHNSYLMSEIIKQLEKLHIIASVPEASIIDFKEALIFGFLGLLRKLEVPNSLILTNNGKKGSMLGVLHLP